MRPQERCKRRQLSRLEGLRLREQAAAHPVSTRTHGQLSINSERLLTVELDIGDANGAVRRRSAPLGAAHLYVSGSTGRYQEEDSACHVRGPQVLCEFRFVTIVSGKLIA